MISELVIRRPQASEYGSVQALIEMVANETFKDLFAPNPVPLNFKDEDWPLAWVAASDEKIVGVIMTKQEWVDDLTRQVGWLALAGALICVVSTSGAYILRKSADSETAKQRLIIDPLLYGFEFAFTAVLIRYVFLR